MMPDAGFLAQDLVELLETYSASQGYDAKKHLKLASNDVPEQYMADPGRLVPILVKAVQELSASNESLLERVSALEARLNTP